MASAYHHHICPSIFITFITDNNPPSHFSSCLSISIKHSTHTYHTPFSQENGPFFLYFKSPRLLATASNIPIGTTTWTTAPQYPTANTAQYLQSFKKKNAALTNKGCPSKPLIWLTSPNSAVPQIIPRPDCHLHTAVQVLLSV